MNRILFVIFIFNKVYLQDIEKENEVYVLNSDNFDEAIVELKPILVNFYAPWCQYSQKLKPHFERVAQDFVAQNVLVKLGKVDIVLETELAKRFGIKQYPTLIFFKEDRKIPYNKTNNYMAISNWLISKTNNLVLRVNLREEYEDVIDKYDVVLMIDESKHTQDYDRAAENIDDIQFVVSASNLFVSFFSSYRDVSLIIRRKIDGEVIPFYGTITQENIRRFTLTHDLPPVVTYSMENGAKIFSNPYKQQHFLVFLPEQSEKVKSELKLASENHNEVRFAIIDVSQNVSDNIVTFFKVDKDKLPYMILSDTQASKTYKPDFSEINGVNIDGFVADVKNGKVKQFLRSQPVPEDWNKEPLKVLVGKNFEEVAYDKSKHVFVEFYAPWCSHCKELAPIWEKLATSLLPVSDLVIAKLDKTENDIKDIEIKSFPTLKLFLKDTNEMISYAGRRNKEAFIEFLSKYVNLKMENDKREL